MDTNKSFSIETVTAFLAIDNDGKEGVMGARFGSTFYPLICADEERIAQMFPMAEAIKQQTGMAYRVVQFSARVDVTEETNKKFKK